MKSPSLRGSISEALYLFQDVHSNWHIHNQRLLRVWRRAGLRGDPVRDYRHEVALGQHHPARQCE